MTPFLTILVGVFVFVLSQWLLRLFLEPILEIRSLGPRLRALLYERANRMHSESEESRELQKQIRRIAADYAEKTSYVPFYRVISRAIALPTPKEVDELIKLLTGISNGVGRKDPQNPINPKINHVFFILKLEGIGPWKPKEMSS
jgi:hypothetical protein